MSLIGLIALVIVVCLIVYLVQAWNPPAPWRNVIFGVMLLVLVLWLLTGFGALAPGVWGHGRL